VESTNSKDYSSPVSNPENTDTSDTAAETGVKNLDIAPAEHGEDALTTTSDTGAIEYKPAEYFRGDQIAHLAQSMVVSKAITNVKPEVLASGRILTHMTPIPSTLKVTMSTTSESISSTGETENGVNHEAEADKSQT